MQIDKEQIDAKNKQRSAKNAFFKDFAKTVDKRALLTTPSPASCHLSNNTPQNKHLLQASSPTIVPASTKNTSEPVIAQGASTFSGTKSVKPQKTPEQAPTQQTSHKNASSKLGANALKKETSVNSYGGFTLEFPTLPSNTQATQKSICRWLMLYPEKNSQPLIDLHQGICKHLFKNTTLRSLSQQVQLPILAYTRLLLCEGLTLESLETQLLQHSENGPIETTLFFNQNDVPCNAIPEIQTLSKKEKFTLWQELTEIAQVDLFELN